MNFRRALNRIVQIFTANVGLKAGSLILAVILWITITGQGNADRIIRDIPFQIRDIPQGFELTDKGAGVIQARIRGPKSLIPTIKLEDFNVTLTLPDDVQPGQVNLEVTRSNLTTPYSNQLTIMQIIPGSVTVTLDRIIEKSVRVQPFLRGATDPDYELGQWRVSPPYVTIVGPESILETIDVVYTEAIDIVDQTLSFDDRVDLKPKNSLVKVLEPVRVTARIEIKERITERSFPEFEITIVPDASDIDLLVTPSVVTLTMTGPAAILNSLKPSDIQLVVDWTDLNAGEHQIRPILVTDEERIIEINVDPDIVTIVIPEPTPSPSPSPTPTSTPE